MKKSENSKNTKRALAASIGCVALCTAMLVGTTFAWFTDTATTGVSKIQAGTLDVQLVGDDGNELTNGLSFTNKNGSTDILWEPGATFKTGGFKVKNAGSLAIKYKLTIDGLDGDGKLLNAIDFSVVGADGTAVDLSTFEGNLSAEKTSDVYYIQAKMKESAGNEYQGLSLEGIKLTVSATQYTEELDSTTNQYDANAQYATPVSTVDELAAAIAKGEDVVLTKDLTIPNTVESGDTLALEVKSDVTIYGNGKTILQASDPDGGGGRVINVNDNTSPVTLTLSGVNIVGPTEDSYNRGVSVYGNSDVTIVMDNCTASANHYALNIAKANEKVNVTVRNSTLTGYSAFQTASAGTKATFENCTLTGLNQWPSSGDNDYAAIVIADAAENSELTFSNGSVRPGLT